MKVSRPSRKNPPKAEVKGSSDRQGPVGQAGQQEQGEQHRRQLFNLRRSRNMVASQRDDQVRSKVSGKVSHRKIRHRVSLNRCGSGRPHPGHLWAQLSAANLAEGRLPDCISRSRLRPVEDRWMKRALNETECRVLGVSRLRHNSTSSRRSSSNEVARLRELTAARDSGSRKVGSKDNQKKRLRHGRNNFGAITPAAPK